MKLVLTREPSKDYGTFGIIALPDGRQFDTLELPDKNNQPKISCIPEGMYLCKIVNSPKFGRVYGVSEVPSRSAILIHAGNYGGDVTKGYRTDIQGCILLGKTRGQLNGQPAVIDSKQALKEFMAIVNDNSFELVIK